MNEPLTQTISWLWFIGVLLGGTCLTVLIVLALDAGLDALADWRDRKHTERNAR